MERFIMKEQTVKNEEVEMTAEDKKRFDQGADIMEEAERIMKKALLKQKIKHYGKQVAIGAGVGALGYFAIKALRNSEIEVDEIMEDVYDEIGG